MNLGTLVYEKNELTDSELALFYAEICKLKHQPGYDNWRQHYVAWLLTYITGVRPGSLTVSCGYEKGAIVAEEEPPVRRAEDQCLRWKHVEFERFAHGIGAKITFYFLKGHRNEHVQARTRLCKFFPSSLLLLVSYAIQRTEHLPSSLLLGKATTSIPQSFCSAWLSNGDSLETRA